MKKLFMISGLSVALLTGCDEPVKSESNVEITVMTAFTNSSGSHGEKYTDKEIERYELSVNNSRVSIYLKDGSKVVATNFVLKTKGEK